MARVGWNIRRLLVAYILTGLTSGDWSGREVVSRKPGLKGWIDVDLYGDFSLDRFASKELDSKVPIEAAVSKDVSTQKAPPNQMAQFATPSFSNLPGQ